MLLLRCPASFGCRAVLFVAFCCRIAAMTEKNAIPIALQSLYIAIIPRFWPHFRVENPLFVTRTKIKCSKMIVFDCKMLNN